MKIVYMDYNCFQRSMDDPAQIRIQMEAMACNEVFVRAVQSKLSLVWSFMHHHENAVCPFPRSKSEVLNIAALCDIQVHPATEILHRARQFEIAQRIRANDALHLACAIAAKANVFLTCDDPLIRRARKIKLPFRVMNPVGFITGEPQNEADEIGQ